MLPVRDVFFGLGVDVLFGQPEVDDVNGVLPFAARSAHEKVFWLHVPVDQTAGVNVLHPRYLVGEGNNIQWLNTDKKRRSFKAFTV